jgi:NADPH:quinone reductase-like Zn-dependent oxidoreductase
MTFILCCIVYTLIVPYTHIHIFNIIARDSGASFIAATSSQKSLVEQLGADLVIDYNSSNWWENDLFKKQPFDCIIDCVGGNDHYNKASLGVVKSRWRGGKFVAVSGNEPVPMARTWAELIGFAIRMLWTPIWSSFCPWRPKYTMVMNQATSENIQQVLSLMEQKRLTIALDRRSPFAFTEEGVKEALTIQESGRAHGKIVVKIT